MRRSDTRGLPLGTEFMYCPKCGMQLPPGIGAKPVCHECGAALYFWKVEAADLAADLAAEVLAGMADKPNPCEDEYTYFWGDGTVKLDGDFTAEQLRWVIEQLESGRDDVERERSER